MLRHLALFMLLVTLATATLSRPAQVAAASTASPGFATTGQVECVSPGWQVRLRSPTVGTLYPNDPLRASTVAAAVFVRLSYEGTVWSDWSLQRMYSTRTANYYAAATWDDTVKVYVGSREMLVQVVYRAYWWNGRAWLQSDLWADEYTTYIGPNHFRDARACVIGS